MPEQLAYHSLVYALEGHAGWTPERCFASGVWHAVDGHLPYARFVAAGAARLQEGASDAAVRRRVHEFLRSDINPLILFLSSLRRPASVHAAVSAYNEACGGVPAALLPRPCWSGMAAFADAMPALGRMAPAQSVTALAARLGLQHSAAAEVAGVFEMEGDMPIADVAGKLGCQRRTLERQLQRMAISAETIRQACRLVRATWMLGSSASLTQIAFHTGYADTSHMTRAFRRAAGLPPSVLRRMLLDDLKHGA